MSHDSDSSDTGVGTGETDGPGLGTDGTIPDSENGIALGHDPDGSHFNPEEDTDEDADADGAPTAPAAGSDSSTGDDDPYEIETDLGPDGPAQV